MSPVSIRQNWTLDNPPVSETPQTAGTAMVIPWAYRGQVRLHHFGFTWLTLASCSSAPNLEAGDDRVQVHTQSRTIIPGWWLRTGLICCCQATPAVCQRKDTGASPDQNCHRHQSLLFPLLSYETIYPGTSNSVLLSTNFCEKTIETPVYQLLQAHPMIFYFALYKCTLYYYYYYYPGPRILCEKPYTREPRATVLKLRERPLISLLTLMPLWLPLCW